jgi:hypothetical protein
MSPLKVSANLRCVVHYPELCEGAEVKLTQIEIFSILFFADFGPVPA